MLSGQVPFTLRVPLMIKAMSVEMTMMMEMVMEMMVKLETGAFLAKLQGKEREYQTLNVYMSEESAARALSLDGQ